MAELSATITVTVKNVEAIERLAEAMHALLDSIYVDEETETTEAREFFAALDGFCKSLCSCQCAIEDDN